MLATNASVLRRCIVERRPNFGGNCTEAGGICMRRLLCTFSSRTKCPSSSSFCFDVPKMGIDFIRKRKLYLTMLAHENFLVNTMQCRESGTGQETNAGLIKAKKVNPLCKDGDPATFSSCAPITGVDIQMNIIQYLLSRKNKKFIRLRRGVILGRLLFSELLRGWIDFVHRCSNESSVVW